MRSKISYLEALVTEKDKCIAYLEVELQQTKTEFEPEVNKVRQASAETVVDLSTTAQVRIDDLKDEVNHVRQLNETIESVTP
jgi:predicted RNase H-like nuclease (RuvC/YqgF family)